MGGGSNTSALAGAACPLSKHQGLRLEQSKPTGSPGLPPLPQGPLAGHAPQQNLLSSASSLLISPQGWA